MKKYIYTVHGLGHMMLGDKDIVLNFGDVVELDSENQTVKDWVEYGYLKPQTPEGALLNQEPEPGGVVLDPPAGDDKGKAGKGDSGKK